jgi:hypothetical protein
MRAGWIERRFGARRTRRPEQWNQQQAMTAEA